MHMLLGALLSVVAATGDVSEVSEPEIKPLPTVVDSPPVPEAAREPTVVVGIYPQAMTVPLVVGSLTRSLALHVPVSITWALAPSTALYVEIAGTFVVSGNDGRSGGTLGLSSGALFSFGPSALQGFFICPKVGFQLSSAVTRLVQERTNGPLDLGPAWSRAFLGGADVGYQWTWGSRHIAIMFGLSIGYEYDNDGPFVEPLGLQRGLRSARTTAPRNEGFAFAFNGNIFRIGFAL